MQKIMDSVDELLRHYDASKRGKLKSLRDILGEKFGVLSELDMGILDQIEDDEIEKEIEETSELKGKMQERIVNIVLAIRSDNSSSENEDDDESISSAASVSSSKKSSKSEECEADNSNCEIAEISDQEIWRKPR